MRLIGAPNFRDLAGLRTAHGRVIGQGRLLRSGHLGELHEQDIAQLARWLGKDVCVIDLRGAAERAKAACALPHAVVHSLPIEPSVAQKLDAVLVAGGTLSAHMAQRFMVEAYENFVRNARPQLATCVQHALDRAGRPLVVHCAAGKDRTGFVIAMLLSALDVPRATIMEDYLLTNQRVHAREGRRYPPDIVEVLRTVRSEFLEAAFAVVDHEFGGCDRYLLQAAGLTPERRIRLQQGLLSP